MSAPTITYVGDPYVTGGLTGGDNNAVLGFISQFDPVPGKSEWGMDTLMRTMRGTQPNLPAFMNSLAQGQVFTYFGHSFFLQTWECDNNPVFPAVRLMYKGLINGVAGTAPKASGGEIEQSITLSAGNVPGYTSATRDIRYLTRQSTTLYITTSRPTAGTYGLDASFSPVILYSVIRATDTAGNNYVFNGTDAPAALVSALTPAPSVVSLPDCQPVVGSPYFECTDRSSLLYIGS